VDGRPLGTPVIVVRRASDRAVTHGPGITTWHSFSSGAHYDAGNVGFGGLVACDEHLLTPGAGFGAHAHRGLEIVTRVLSGTLDHSDSLGGRATIRPGTVAHLSAGSGVEHAERNGSADELRFVQMWLLGEAGAPTYRTGGDGVQLADARFDVLRLDGDAAVTAAPLAFVFVASGRVRLGDAVLSAGDEARIRDDAATFRGGGELLVWQLSHY
jgi:redox-sensitive bicupin YhaK (pirin superfamily)